MTVRRRSMLAALLVSGLALGASRGRYGGTARVALAAGELHADPLLADSPAEAALLSLWTPALCRLDASGRAVPVLVQELQWQGPLRLHLVPRAGAPAAVDLAAALSRAVQGSAPSPYRALLFPLRNEGRGLSAAEGAVDLTLRFPWPDLDRSLCHPALGIWNPAKLPAGPYVASAGAGAFNANLAFPEGRPYPDRLFVQTTTERAAGKLLTLRQADLVLGVPDDDGATPPPALYTTYLAYRPSRVGETFRPTFDALVDPSDLARFFVRAPAVPIQELLPPALMPQQPAPRGPVPASAPGPGPRKLTLLYDASHEDQRAVAERILFKLRGHGFDVTLQGLPRGELRARWARGDYDLLLQAVLLPPSPPAALALAIELSGRHDLLQAELPPIGAIPDAAARDARAKDRAHALRSTLPLVPLYSQALGWRARPAVGPLPLEGHGLPALEQLFLTE